MKEHFKEAKENSAAVLAEGAGSTDGIMGQVMSSTLILLCNVFQGPTCRVSW